MKKLLFLSLSVLILWISASAQSENKNADYRFWYQVSIGKGNGNTTNSAAWLELGTVGTTKGFIFPRTVKDSVSFVFGNSLFNTVDSSLYLANGLSWLKQLNSYNITSTAINLKNSNVTWNLKNNISLDSILILDNNGNLKQIVKPSGIAGAIDTISFTVPSGFTLNKGTIKTNNDTLKITTTLNGVIHGNGSGFTASQIVDADVYNVGWNKITGTPTTLAGYGITDAVSTARTALSATSPLVYNSSTGVFSIPKADSTHAGYLSAADWDTFYFRTTPVLSWANVTAGSSKITLGGTPTGSVHTAFSVDVNEANLTLGNIGGTLPITKGGTNATTANAALNNLLPSQTGHANNFLFTNGTTSSWVFVDTSTENIYVQQGLTAINDSTFTWGGRLNGNVSESGINFYGITFDSLAYLKINLGSDATGDIYYRNSLGRFVRLPIGSSGQLLSINSGLPSWVSASGILGTPNLQSVTTVGNTTTTGIVLNGIPATGTGGQATIGSDASGNFAFIGPGDNFKRSFSSLNFHSRNDIYYLPDTSGTIVLDTTTQTLRNKTLISPIINLGSDNTGDLYYRNSSGLLTRLGIGTSGQVLTVSGSIPIWQTPSSGGGSGTVTSVNVTVPSGLSISGGPVTTTGTMAITTALNGIVNANGAGFSTVTIGSGLTYASGVLSNSQALLNAIAGNGILITGTYPNLTWKADTSIIATQYGLGLRVRYTDTAGMLSTYARTVNVVKYTDTALMLSKYLRKSDTSAMLAPYAKTALVMKYTDTSAMLAPYLKSSVAASTYATITNLALKVNISDTASMLSVYLRKLDTLSLSNRINLKVNIADTSTMLAHYLRGAGVAGQVAYFGATNSLTSNANFTFNGNQAIALGPNLVNTATSSMIIGTLSASSASYSLVVGQNNFSAGTYSLIAGLADTVTSAIRAFEFGTGLYSKWNNQTLVGTFNDSTNSAPFIVGIGANSSTRANGFYIDASGNGFIKNHFTGITETTSDSSNFMASTAWVKRQLYGSGSGASNLQTVTALGNSTNLGIQTLYNSAVPSPAQPSPIGFVQYADASADLNLKYNSGLIATLKFSGNTANRVYTLPDASGAFVLTTFAQTLTNKTLTSPVINVGSDATGDIYYRNASGLFTRLAIGTTNQVLTVIGGIPSWITPAGSGAGTVSSVGLSMPSGLTVTGSPITTTGTLTVSTTLNGLIHGNGSGFTAGQAVDADIASMNFSKLLSTPTTLAGYGITDPIVLTTGSYANPSWITSLAWSKITGTPTTVAGYGITDAVTLTGTQTLTNKTLTNPVINLGLDNTGDLYYRNSLGQLTRLAAGSSTQILTMSSGLPSWQNPPATGGTGTVTSVAIAVPSGLAVSGSPITSSGTISITTSLNGVIHGTGSGFSASQIVDADVANVSFAKLTSLPTTLAGHGITDGVTLSTAQSITGGKTFTTSPAISTMTLGSVLFAGTSGTITQDNANFFWDNTNKRLGINVSGAPGASLHVAGAVRFDLGSDLTGDLYYRNSGGLLTRLAIGLTSQVLTVVGGLPTWQTASGGSSTTIYSGNGTLASARTVAGGGNSLTFSGMSAFNITSIPVNITGDLNVNHVYGNSGQPSTNSLAAGITSATINSAGSDNDFQVTVVTSAAVAGTLFRINFVNAWTHIPVVVWSPQDQITASFISHLSMGAISTTQIIVAGSMSSAATYVFNVHVAG